MKIYLFDWCLAKPPDGVAVQTESDNIVVDHLEVRKEFLDAISDSIQSLEVHSQRTDPKYGEMVTYSGVHVHEKRFIWVNDLEEFKKLMHKLYSVKLMWAGNEVWMAS